MLWYDYMINVSVFSSEVHNKPIDAQIKQCNQCNPQINPVIQPNGVIDFYSFCFFLLFYSLKVSLSSLCTNALDITALLALHFEYICTKYTFILICACVGVYNVVLKTVI